MEKKISDAISFKKILITYTFMVDKSQMYISYSEKWLIQFVVISLADNYGLFYSLITSDVFLFRRKKYLLLIK